MGEIAAVRRQWDSLLERISKLTGKAKTDVVREKLLELDPEAFSATGTGRHYAASWWKNTTPEQRAAHQKSIREALAKRRETSKETLNQSSLD
jgi:hypothetical protein